ncbi:hypothetical protein C4J81_14570 [Deltaproteobacteria bacterium Smac51]|nr:hypothetical protein C4J81_14570 [Deltaproteobacteria bacterium Smac51]
MKKVEKAETEMSKVIINLPYTAQAAPPAVAKRLALSPEEWQLEHWRLIDPYLAEMAAEAAVFQKRDRRIERPLIIYPYSPVVADPWGLWAAELSEDDSISPGAPATLPQTTAGKAINWSDKDRETIFSRTTLPFLQQIEDAAHSLLEEAPLVLIVTLRSFTSMPQNFEKDRRYPRPQACVSTAGKLTPEGLANMTGDTFRAFRWWAELNLPQAGTACAPESLRNHPRVRTIGLSLCRSLYMDENTGRKKPAIRSVIRVLKTVFNLFDQELSRVAKLRIERATKPKDSPVIKADRLKELSL